MQSSCKNTNILNTHSHIGMLILIDKPAGITSFDCIRILKKRLGPMKMGHAGTLDPMATGLMIIGTGEDTKKLSSFLKLPKGYEAEILFGVKTDTGDITGRKLSIFNFKFLNNEEVSKFSKKIQGEVKNMVGKLDLPVPRYSAIKRGGEPLYKKARRGEEVEPPIKTMEVEHSEFIEMRQASENGHDIMIAKVKFEVGSGTYVRSLAEELGRRLSVPATLSGLRRTKIGDFKVEDAMKLV